MPLPTKTSELVTAAGFFVRLCGLIPNPAIGKIHCLRDHWQIVVTKRIRILEFVAVLVRPSHNNVEPRLPFVTGCRVQTFFQQRQQRFPKWLLGYFQAVSSSLAFEP